MALMIEYRDVNFWCYFDLQGVPPYIVQHTCTSFWCGVGQTKVKEDEPFIAIGSKG